MVSQCTLTYIVLEKRGNSEIKIGFTIICSLETTMTGSHNTSIQKQTKLSGVNPNTKLFQMEIKKAFQFLLSLHPPAHCRPLDHPLAKPLQSYRCYTVE